MKKKRYRTENFQEDYLLNNSEFHPDFRGIRVYSFCHSMFRPSWIYYRRNLPFIMVSMILSGGDKYTSSDGELIRRHSNYFSISDLNTVLPGRGQQREDVLERYFIQLEVTHFLRELLQILFPEGLPRFMPPHPERLKRGFEDIRRVLRKKGETDNELLSAMTFRLLSMAAGQLTPPSRLPKPLVSALRHIDNKFIHASLTRHEIAAAAGVSAVALGKMFQTYLHTTVNHYVVKMRLEQAKRLLTQTRYPISEIASQCGFAYSHYFSRVFQEQNGIRPGDYRRRNDEAAGRKRSSNEGTCGLLLENRLKQ